MCRHFLLANGHHLEEKKKNKRKTERPFERVHLFPSSDEKERLRRHLDRRSSFYFHQLMSKISRTVLRGVLDTLSVTANHQVLWNNVATLGK